MLKKLTVLGLIVAAVAAIVGVNFPDGIVAVVIGGILSAAAILVFRQTTEEKTLITWIFLYGLVLRLGFGLFVHIFELREFFGGDAFLYDLSGVAMADYWSGKGYAAILSTQMTKISGAAWGMTYLTGALYYLIGQNIFAAQTVCAVIGAATAPVVYLCGRMIYGNLNVAKVAAVGVAIFPSFVIWSAQLLKDGLIIFLLVVAITTVLKLQQKFDYRVLGLLIFSLFGILSLRFYIFYMVVVAVAGSFLMGLSETRQSMLRNFAVLVLVGLGLVYLGVGRQAAVDLPEYVNLERIQSSRLNLAQAARTGYGEDVDVSTAEGAITTIPMGFTYLMFAPFPWQAENLRQAITIPEVLVWWLMIPLVVWGMIYSIKHRLRSAFPILIFSLMLTIAYSVFQGNVGTAYRQRTQIQVFLFILMGVGWTLWQEKRENDRLSRMAAQRRVEAQIRARHITT
jgi:4-amino-4-deoxy-L-arabinose transferase-like glycosyltransferase